MEMSSISINDLPQWDGEEITFHSWWKRFQSYAVVEGFSEALQEEFRNKLPRKQQENAFEFDNAPMVKAEQEKAVKTSVPRYSRPRLAFGVSLEGSEKTYDEGGVQQKANAS